MEEEYARGSGKRDGRVIVVGNLTCGQCFRIGSLYRLVRSTVLAGFGVFP